MTGWLAFVDVVRALLFAAAHVCGNSLGGGILAVSLVVRVALLPLTLRAAHRALAHQAKLAALAPHVTALKRRHGSDRARLAQATMELYRHHDIEIVPRGTFGTMLVQGPIGAALYRAFGSGLGARTAFLWISDLTRPDAAVAAGAALLAGAAAAVTPSSNRTAIALAAFATLALAWRLSASVGLYWFASNAVGVVQAVLVRRNPRPAA